MSSSSNLLLYLSARADQILNTLIEEAILASCKSDTGGCSGRKEEERGVEGGKELDVGVEANRRLFVGGTPSLGVRTGEDAKDWERNESEGVTKDFVNFGGGFEVEALAFIAQGGGLNKSRLADHMSRNKRTRLAGFFAYSCVRPPDTMQSAFIFAVFPLDCYCVR